MTPEQLVAFTDADWLTLGRNVASRYQKGMLVDGRPITNVEMLALIRLHKAELRQRIDHDGCCCEKGPFADGHCRRGPGLCAAVVNAERIIWKDDHGI